MENKIFSKSLFISNLKRYWIIPFVVTIIIFLAIPFSIMLQNETNVNKTNAIKELGSYLEDENIGDIANNYGNLSIEQTLYSYINPVIFLIFPVIISIQIFKYLQKNKSTTFIHGLPLSKKQIYITNILSGFLLLLIPYVVNFVILMAIKLFAEIGEYILFSSLLKWFSVNILFNLIIFAFSSFIGILAGTGFAHGFLTYVFMYLPNVLVLIIESMLSKLILGFPGFSDNVTEFLTQIPFIKMFRIFVYNSETKSYLNDLGTIHIIIYIAIIIVLGVLGYILYKKRKLEKAGDFAVFKIVKEILKYLATFLIMGFSYLYCSLFISNKIILVMLSLIFAGIAYFISEVIMRKTYKVLKTFKGFIIYAVISIIGYVIISNNVIGYETFIPQIDDIQYVEASLQYKSDDNVQYEEKDNIELVINLQKTLIENKEKQGILTSPFNIKYKLKNGNEVIRKYGVEMPQTEIETLEKSNEYINKTYSYLFNEEESKKINYITLYGIYENTDININLYKKDDNFNEVINALKSDISQLKVYTNSDKAMTDSFLYVGILLQGSNNEKDIYYNYLEANCEIVKLIKNKLVKTE